MRSPTAGSGSSRRPLRLSWAQYCVVAGSLLTICVVAWFTMTPYPEWLLARYIAVPRLQEEFGFRWGQVPVGAAGVETAEGFVDVTPGGPLGSAGIQASDVIEDNGALTLYHALRALAVGQEADLYVISASRLRELLTQGVRGVALEREYRRVHVLPLRTEEPGKRSPGKPR